MNSLIIYWSGTGNTKEVAEAIHNTLQNSGVHSLLKRVEEAKDEDLYEYDLVFIGSPSYMWHPPAPMEKYIKECDVILLFCSPDATASEAVKKEWMSSLKLEKKMIPIFKDPIDIPALLTTKLGVQYDSENFDKFVNDIYALIKKKTQTE